MFDVFLVLFHDDVPTLADGHQYSSSVTTAPSGFLFILVQVSKYCSFMRKGSSQYSPCAAPSYPILFTSGQAPRSTTSPVAASTLVAHQGAPSSPSMSMQES